MTAFLRNCWYVGAWSHEVAGDRPLPRKIIGEPIALFRTEDGAVHALRDRCPHRWLPLSMGRFVGGRLRCGYHGLEFSPDGSCVHVPGSDIIPPKVRAQAYPVVERDSWVWIWMGDRDAADPTLIPPAFGIDNDRWTMRAGQMEYAANFMLVNDNLCDLSHVDFVHENTLGLATGYGWSDSEVQVIAHDRGVRIQRWLMAKPASPKKPDLLVDTWSTYDYSAPGVFVMQNRSYAHGTCKDAGHGEPSEPPMTYRVDQQAVTPIDEKRTLYFYASGFNAGGLPPRLADEIFDVIMSTFAEDRAILESQQRVWDETPTETPMAFIPQDRGPAMFRRTMNRLLASDGSAA